MNHLRYLRAPKICGLNFYVVDEKLKGLYQKVILAKSKAPFQYEKRENVAHQVEANNPVCGDRFTLYLEIEDGLIADAAFYGHGCAISKSSASILIENIIGIKRERDSHDCFSLILSYFSLIWEKHSEVQGI